MGVKTRQEVSSKTYRIKEIIDYLQDCMEEPRQDTNVYFTIRDGGELAIITSSEDVAGEIEGSGFTELQKKKSTKYVYSIKVNLPETQEEYEQGAGEGCFFLVDKETMEAYEQNATGGGFFGILDNDSYYYPGLKHGERLPLEMRGDRRPVVPLEALQRWSEPTEGSGTA